MLTKPASLSFLAVAGPTPSISSSEHSVIMAEKPFETVFKNTEAGKRLRERVV
jgi:hypothetical protein